MSVPVQLVIALLGLIAAARTRLTGVVLGQPVNVPVLLLVAAVLVLLLAAVMLLIARALMEDWRLQRRMVTR